MNDLVKAEPRPNLVAGGKPQAIVPQTMDEAYRFAKAVCLAGMAPRGMDTPEKAMIAIMRGLEVGLTPFQALDKIAVVNGRPTIWGDGAMALVRGSGLCEFVRETMKGEGEAMVATCLAKRRGEAEPIVGEFSVADAKKAGLWGKQGPWQQFPKRMLQMRARAFALRDGFADVLGGLYLREEMEDSDKQERLGRPEPPAPPPLEPPGMVSITASPVRDAVGHTIDQPEPPVPPEPPAPPAIVSWSWEGRIRTALQACETIEAMNDAFDKLTHGLPDGETLDECQAVLREIASSIPIEEE